MVDQILKNQMLAQTGQEELRNRLASVCNALYSMLTAEKTFNPANGTCKSNSIGSTPYQQN